MAKPLFREVFQHPHREVLNWFPGHMIKGMRNMQQKLRSVDGIIEVHDARIPLSGRNRLFRQKISLVRPHLLLMNKSDLADLTRKDEIIRKLRSEGFRDVLFTDCLRKQDSAVKEVIPAMVDMIKSTPRYDRASSSATIYNLMIIGVPNVGKSSFINTVRKIYTKKDGKAAAVAAQPGHTRCVREVITVSEKPKVFVIDTPGIAHPNVADVDAAMKLAMCHVMQDYLVGEEMIVDYMLYWMNKNRDFRYVKHFDLAGPTDSVAELLVGYATRNKLYMTIKPVEGGGWSERPDGNAAARSIMRDFRSGKMGKFMLDGDILSSCLRP